MPSGIMRPRTFSTGRRNGKEIGAMCFEQRLASLAQTPWAGRSRAMRMGGEPSRSLTKLSAAEAWREGCREGKAEIVKS